jgi:hypothetical protein
MQYFQNANSKQIVGHAATTFGWSFNGAALVEVGVARARGINAMATAISILFMTVSFWGYPVPLQRPST